MAGYLPIGGNGGGTGINLPDDHIFATTDARDTAIPNPTQGEQCAVQAGEPQYHLLQEYRVDKWVDITYLIRGPKGDKGNIGEKGETVKITSVENELDTDGKLKTKVALDDGTSAESDPLPLNIPEKLSVDGVDTSKVTTGPGIKSSAEGDSVSISFSNDVYTWGQVEVTHAESPYQINADEDAGKEYVANYASGAGIVNFSLGQSISDGKQVKFSLINTSQTLFNAIVTTSEGEWPITTPTLFAKINGVWRPEESSQMLHVENSTTFDGSGALKTVIHGITVDPASDITAAVSSDGLLVIGRTYTPPTDSVDIAFWWTDNAEPDASDILNAMSQTQTADIISHTDDFNINDLQKKTMTAKRDEDSFKYLFFAWHKGFFSPEPTKVDTGWGQPSTWIETEVAASGILYKVLTVEVKNNSILAENYALVQEGVR